jgi:hypothetical protein
MNEIELYLSGLSIPEVSEKTGIPKSTIRFRLKKLCLLRSRADGIKIAAKNGKLSHLKGKKRSFSDEWKKNISRSKIGKGKGFSKKPNGYIEITMGENKGRLHHVVVMEKIIGRSLMANECVHHKDENKSNNDPSNLELMTRSEHSRHHALENINHRKRDSAGRLI